MLQTILIDILGFIASAFLFALALSKKFEDWVIKFLTFIYVTLIDMKYFIIRFICGIIIFSFIGISLYGLINDYGHSIGQFPMILFIGFTIFYIIHFTDYIRLMIELKTYRYNNKTTRYIQTEESKGYILRTNLATIAMTIIYMIPAIIYAWYTNSFSNLIKDSGLYLMYAFLLNDMLVQMIKEKTTIENNTTIQ